jgi:hypothetical protein
LRQLRALFSVWPQIFGRAVACVTVARVAFMTESDHDHGNVHDDE